MGIYLLYQIDKMLGIIPREVFDHLDLDIIRIDCLDQRDAVMSGEGMTDQLFPDRMFAAHEKAVKLINV